MSSYGLSYTVLGHLCARTKVRLLYLRTLLVWPVPWGLSWTPLLYSVADPLVTSRMSFSFSCCLGDVLSPSHLWCGHETRSRHKALVTSAKRFKNYLPYEVVDLLEEVTPFFGDGNISLSYLSLLDHLAYMRTVQMANGIRGTPCILGSPIFLVCLA